MKKESEDDPQRTNIIQCQNISFNESLTPGQIFKRRIKQAFGIPLPKNVVFAAHGKVCAGLNIRRVARQEARQINLYYENFAQYADVLIPAFQREITNSLYLIRQIAPKI